MMQLPPLALPLLGSTANHVSLEMEPITDRDQHTMQMLFPFSSIFFNLVWFPE
jgi:hypothetical protein